MKKNIGFTLAEAIVTVGLVGVLVVAAVSAVKKSGDISVFKGYKAAYAMVSEVCFNINDALKGDVSLTQRWNLTTMARDKATGTRSIFMLDGGKDGVLPNMGFCDILEDNLNAVVNNCDRPIVPMNSTVLDDDDFHLVTSSGVRIAIGPVGNMPIKDQSGADQTVMYRLIFVDVNGADQGTNTLANRLMPRTATIRNYADIVPFVVIMDGTVLPVGIAEMDIRFIGARVLYPPYNLNNVANSIETSSNMSYFNAKCAAWGNRTDYMDTASYRFNAYFANTTFVRPTPPFMIGVNYPTLDEPASQTASACPSTAPSVQREFGCTTKLSKCYVLLNVN